MARKAFGRIFPAQIFGALRLGFRLAAALVSLPLHIIKLFAPGGDRGGRLCFIIRLILRDGGRKYDELRFIITNK